MYIYTYIDIYVCIYIYMYMCICVYMYTYICISTYMHTQIYIHIYVYIYIYTYPYVYAYIGIRTIIHERKGRMQSTPRGPKQVEIVKRGEKHLKRYLAKRPTKDTTEKERAGAPKGAAAGKMYQK